MSRLPTGSWRGERASPAPNHQPKRFVCQGCARDFAPGVKRTLLGQNGRSEFCIACFKDRCTAKVERVEAATFESNGEHYEYRALPQART